MVVFFFLQELEREGGRGEWEGERGRKGRAELSAGGTKLTRGSAGGVRGEGSLRARHAREEQEWTVRGCEADCPPPTWRVV